VHAYFHGKEGDQGNAAHWYSRAGKPVCREPLDAEWLGILKVLLEWSNTALRDGHDTLACTKNVSRTLWCLVPWKLALPAFFAPAFTFAHRFFIAAEIFARAAADMSLFRALPGP
jgi:hypothetical protein